MNLHQNKVYQPIVAGPWSGFQEVTTVAAEPRTSWSGHKLSRALVQQIISFFEWSMQETKSEVVVTLFYHAEHGWQALVLPQEGYNNMTVKLLEDHPNRIPTYQRLGRGWSPMGSWHHHCAATAFASGTDQHDEKSKEGLHLTTGGLGTQLYSLHARVSFRHVVTPANLGEWFDCESAIAPALRDKQIEWELCQPVNGEFPDWWKENVIKVERPAFVSTYTGAGNSYSSGFDPENQKKKWFNYKLHAICTEFQCTPEDVFAQLLEFQEDDFVAECASMLAYCELNLNDAIKHMVEAHQCAGPEAEAEVGVAPLQLEDVSAVTHHHPGCACEDCEEVRGYYSSFSGQ